MSAAMKPAEAILRLRRAIERLLLCTELNLDDMDESTISAIDVAKDALRNTRHHAPGRYYVWGMRGKSEAIRHFRVGDEGDELWTGGRDRASRFSIREARAHAKRLAAKYPLYRFFVSREGGAL